MGMLMHKWYQESYVQLFKVCIVYHAEQRRI